MNRTQRFFCSVGIFLALLCAAPPRAISAGDEWLPIPPADLALNDNPASPGANAMILYLQSDIDSKGSFVNTYVRIKVFTQEGTKQGDVDIPYVAANTSIEAIHGRTIHPDGSVVNFQGKVFDKTIVKGGAYRHLAKTFTLPDVHPGSIIEYKYREQNDKDYYINESWVITNSLFTRDERFTIKPDTREYALLMAFRQYHLPIGTLPPALQPDGSYTMDIHNIAGLEEEEYMPPKRALEARVDFYYRSRTEPVQETSEHYWQRIAKTWSDEVDRFVNKKGALESELAHTIDANDPPETKLRKIYARVQKIRNLSMEDSKTLKEQKQERLKPNTTVEDVLKHGYATGRELNYTFMGLARAAGFPAFEVFVAPRNVNLFNPELRDTTEISVDIVWVHAGSQDYYLDPSEVTFPFGMLPWFETSTQGIRAKKDGGEVESIPRVRPTEATIVRNADVEIDSEGEATGKIQVDFTGQQAAYRRRQGHDEDEAGRQKTLGEEIKAWLPAGSTFDVTTITDWNNNDLPVHVEGTAKIPTLGTAAGHRMLIPATVFQASEPAAFHPEKRLYPVYFNCPYENIDAIKLHVPAGYKIEAVPPARQVKPGAVSYEISAAQQDNVVEVKRVLVINGILFQPTSYQGLRTFFNSVKTDDDAQIVLRNAETAANN